MNDKQQLFTDQQIEQANQVNLIAYARSRGHEVKRISNNSYKLPGYGGLFISGDGAKWNWFSQNKGGGSIQFVMEMEEGYQSTIAQGGSNVSGGQKQRLSIARAIVRKPEIFLFDDSFSALDHKTEAELRTKLREVTKASTVIVVAQKVTSVMNADQIIVLDQGEIAGIGTHKELLQNSLVYQEIVASQLSKEEIANG